MADFIELFGGKLLGKDGEVDTEAALKSKTAIALYFSGHWCPPCRGFTPQLADWYKNDLQAKGLEVIFVSSDKDDEAFKAYYGEMPWLALPYSEREKKEALSKKFKVNGIPTVVILGPDGKLITADGRAAISSDPTGEEMPWKPKTFKEVFDDAVLLCPGDTKKKGSDLAGKVFGFYFSAHWCPPCRGFTPTLAEWYSTSLKEKGLEIVFVSSDKDEEAFSSYFGEQPWLALDFSDRKRKEQLSQLFGVSGIPSLVIVDKDGSVITKDGRGAITADTTGKEFPWYPKPVSNLNRGPGDINEVTTVVAFCETSDQATQQAIEQAMEPLAKKMKTEAKAQGDDNPRVAFLIVTENSGLAPKVREMLSLPTLPPSKHENSVEDKEGGADCNATAEAVGVETLQAKLMIVDIPDEGAYYEGPHGDVTAETVQKLVDDYLAKSLERKQLD